MCAPFWLLLDEESNLHSSIKFNYLNLCVKKSIMHVHCIMYDVYKEFGYRVKV